MYEEADMFFRSSLAAALEQYPNEKKSTIFEIAMNWTEDSVEDIWDYEQECGEIFDAWTGGDSVMDNLFLQMDIIGAVDKVLKENGYKTDAFFYDSDFDGPDLSKIAEQVVEWAEHHQTLLDEHEIFLKEELVEEA